MEQFTDSEDTRFAATSKQFWPVHRPPDILLKFYSIQPKYTYFSTLLTIGFNIYAFIPVNPKDFTWVYPSVRSRLTAAMVYDFYALVIR